MRRSDGLVRAHPVEIIAIKQLVELLYAQYDCVSTKPVRLVEALFIQTLV